MTFLEKRNKLLERNKDKIMSQKVKVFADNVEAENFAIGLRKSGSDIKNKSLRASFRMRSSRMRLSS